MFATHKVVSDLHIVCWAFLHMIYTFYINYSMMTAQCSVHTKSWCKVSRIKVIFLLVVGKLIYDMKLSVVCYHLFVYHIQTKLTRVYGVIVSAFARRWGGDGFNSRPKPRHS